MDKLQGICRFCKHATVSVSGERCGLAYYRDHGGGYGNSWASNECKHDQHHRPMKDLFEPSGLTEAKIKKDSEVIELRGEVLKLKNENQMLRHLVKDD